MPSAGARLTRDLDAATRSPAGPRLALERVLADLDRHARLRDLDDRRLHDAALTIILRLVVLRSAGARGLLAADPTTSLQTALERRADHDLSSLSAETTAWPRLLLHRHALPNRGGPLFDADLPIDDLTLLQLLRILPATPDLEWIGAVHEVLLDHAVARVDTTTLGLRGAGGRAPDVPLAQLEQLAPDALLPRLRALTGRSLAALARDLRRPPSATDTQPLLRSCGGDEALRTRVAPWAALLRRDADDRPLVLLAGRLRVIASAERRSTGSHYTPLALAESLVRHTLDPLCLVGPAEGLAPASWQPRPAAEILALRVCDLATGCGAFLLAAGRHLAAHLLLTDDCPDLPRDRDERERHARRLVLPCLHGVDRNPIAVELARLSLWLDSASPGAPLDMPATNLQVGDALLGLTDACAPDDADARTGAMLRPRTGELGHYPCGAPRRPIHWPLAFPAVFARERPGFDAILGNPPFQGGQKLAGALGLDYRDYLVTRLAGGRRGSADLCAYFFLRAAALLRTPGQIGLLATSTIAQGDTREVGLDRLHADGLEIVRATASAPWPGAARLAVAQVWLRRGPWAGERMLGERAVPAISPALTAGIAARPHRLRANLGLSFIGSYVLGLGFVLTPAEARALIAADPRNRDVVRPYLNGDDLSRAVDHAPSRWIIDFRDWPLERAADYPDCLARVRERVKPQRDRVRFSPHARERWWLYERPRRELYAALGRAGLVLACARVAKYMHFVRIARDLIASEQLVIVTADDPSMQAILGSAAHEAWALQHASTLDTRRRYTPTDCLETFAMPGERRGLAELADRHDAHRRALMQATGLGLTRTYNRFHDPDQRGPALLALRDLHRELDRAVADAYGWSDLQLGHDFHPTAEGTRFTVSAAARRELQERLLALNHARHAAEQAAHARAVPAAATL